MKNKRTLIVFICVFSIITLFFGCSKNKSLEENKNNKIEAKKEDKKENKKENIRTFNTEPLIYNDKSIPVLMYHSIDYEKGNELRLPKEEFRKQMQYLKDNGYTTLTLDELYNFLEDNKPIPSKAIVITLDDGYLDNYTNAYTILKELGLKATVFAITSNIDKDKRSITSSQIKEMDKNGVNIYSHTYNHDELSKLSYEKQLQTLKRSKEDLEKILNHKVNYIAYPYGKWNDDTIKAAKEAGYKMAFTTQGGWSNKKDGIYTLKRVYISSLKNMDNFKDRITNSEYNKN